MTTQSIIRQAGNKGETRTRFQRLWADSEKLHKENLQLESDLDDLVKRIEAEILEAERGLAEAMRAALDRQLDFAQKKSLLKWQRFELRAWIDEHLTFLSKSGLLDEPLLNKLAVVRAVELGIDIDPDSELSPAEQLDAYFQPQEDELCSSGAPETPEETDLDASIDEMYEFSDVDWDELDQFDQASDSHSEFSKLGSKTSSKPVSDQVFKRIFRQTAAALHPDRETDAERRREKDALMSELLKARKEFDLVTMVRLHNEYANADSELSISDQKELEQVLCEYLVQQHQHRDEIIHRSPIHHIAYTDFYSKSATTVTRRINAHVRTIDERRSDLINFVEQVKTLKMLKEVLKERYDSYPFRDMLT